MALTSTFTTIAVGQTDADSPLDETLMDAIRQDIDVLYEWMGGPTYTPSTSHDHDGTNSKLLTGAGGASLVFLESTVISGSTSARLLDVFSTVYNNYLIKCNNFRPLTSGQHLRGQFSTSGGVDWSVGSHFQSGSTATTTYLILTPTNINITTAANHGSQLDIYISGVGSTLQYPTVTTIGTIWSTNGATVALQTHPEKADMYIGKKDAGGGWDSFRLFTTAANQNIQGEFRIYGFKEA